MVLAHSHDETVHFVVDLHERGSFRGAHGRGRMGGCAKPRFERSCDNSLFLHDWGKRILEEIANLFVIGLRRHDTVSIQNAPCVCIDNENWMISGVQENRVRGFRANAVQAEQFMAQFYCRLRKHLFQGAGVLLIEEGNKRLQALCLLAKVSRGPEEAFEPGKSDCSNGVYSERTCSA